MGSQTEIRFSVKGVTGMNELDDFKPFDEQVIGNSDPWEMARLRRVVNLLVAERNREKKN